MIRIQGWVQVPAPIQGTVDGLLIVDSLGGEPLAERIQKTNNWQAFTLYRVAPQSGPMSVTVALCGLGEARLDDLTIEPLAAFPSPPASVPTSVPQSASVSPPVSPPASVSVPP